MKRGTKKPASRKEDSPLVNRSSRDKKTATDIAVPAQPVALLSDVRELIQQARASIARAIDSGLVMLYWHVGQRMRQDILKEKRAEYGSQINPYLKVSLHQARFGQIKP
ncbi:MAG: DUF1016 N-terminal domain-containing protein [Pirellulaceae bacterium]|nr:DUF1016 N-terminal domain-containing protein [Pirellulaceae bacterium]